MRRLAVVLLPFLFAGLAHAEEKAPSAPATVKPSEAQAAKDEQAEYRMQDVEIRGELERPDVFYIIPRRKADMDLGSLTKRYDSEIMEPILPGDFEAEHSERFQRKSSVTK